MKLECIVYLMKVRPLLLKDLIVHQKMKSMNILLLIIRINMSMYYQILLMNMTTTNPLQYK